MIYYDSYLTNKIGTKRDFTMSHKIQITVDDQLNAFIKTRAKQSGLSISSYTRLALIKALSNRKQSVIAQAINEVESGETEHLTLDEFNDQLNRFL